MKTFTYAALFLFFTATAHATLAEEKRIRRQYGQKYNAKAVIATTQKCVDQYMMLSDNPDVSKLKDWCEKQVINGWKPFSEAEMKKKVEAKYGKNTVIIK